MRPPIAVFWRVLILGALAIGVIDAIFGEFELALSSLGVSYLLYRLGSQEREIEVLRAHLRAITRTKH